MRKTLKEQLTHVAEKLHDIKNCNDMVAQNSKNIRVATLFIQTQVDELPTFSDHSGGLKESIKMKIREIIEELNGISLYVREAKEGLAGVTYDINGNRVD